MIKKLDLSLFFGLLILMIVVSISGCVHSSSSNGTQKYNDEFISFDYPSDSHYTSVYYVLKGGSNWKDVLNVRNEKVFISIVKNENANNLTPSKAKEDDVKRISEKDVADKGGKYLSDTRKTNDNGIEVVSTITSIKDQSDGTIVYKYIDYYFKVNNDIMYSIIIWGNEKNFVDVQSVADTVFNSLKIK